METCARAKQRFRIPLISCTKLLVTWQHTLNQYGKMSAWIVGKHWTSRDARCTQGHRNSPLYARTWSQLQQGRGQAQHKRGTCSWLMKRVFFLIWRCVWEVNRIFRLIEDWYCQFMRIFGRNLNATKLQALWKMKSETENDSYFLNIISSHMNYNMRRLFTWTHLYILPYVC